MGEVAQAHDGSLGTAYAMIDAIAEAGADAVKFQTHIAAAESSADDTWRVKFSHQDATRFDYWKRMEFTPEQWRGLKAHAEGNGLLFLSSPFSVEAVDLLESLDVAMWKVASGEVNNPLLLDRMLETRKPILLSSGMSTWEDLDKTVERIRAADVDLTVFQCTTRYPTPPEEMGLNVLAELRERYKCSVGLSDHSSTVFAGLAAATLGADWLEVHVTLSRRAFGPDVTSSLTVEELRQVVEGARWIDRARANPVSKQMLDPDLSRMQSLFGQSLVAVRDLTVGALLTRQDVGCRKPGKGIPVSQVEDYLGRRLNRPVSSGQFFEKADFEPGEG